MRGGKEWRERVTTPRQRSLFSGAPDVATVAEAVRDILVGYAQPSAWELLAALDRKLGLKAHWAVVDALARVLDHPGSTKSRRDYVRGLLGSEDWSDAMRGQERPARLVESTIDALLRESVAYRNSAAFCLFSRRCTQSCSCTTSTRPKGRRRQRSCGSSRGSREVGPGARYPDGDQRGHA